MIVCAATSLRHPVIWDNQSVWRWERVKGGGGRSDADEEHQKKGGGTQIRETEEHERKSGKPVKKKSSSELMISFSDFISPRHSDIII